MQKKLRGKNFLKILNLALISLIIFNTSIVAAYTTTGQKWKGSSYPIKVTYTWGSYLDTPGTVCRDAFEKALSAWNSKQSKISFSYSSSSSNILNTEHISDDSKYGDTDWSYDTSTNYIAYFKAYINADNGEITDPNVAESAGCHELGHSIGLSHSTETAIMNSDRDREKIYVPQTDDLNGIKAIYK